MDIKSDDETCCIICLEPIIHENTTSSTNRQLLSCPHASKMHNECLSHWYVSRALHQAAPKCPLCNAPCRNLQLLQGSDTIQGVSMSGLRFQARLLRHFARYIWEHDQCASIVQLLKILLVMNSLIMPSMLYITVPPDTWIAYINNSMFWGTHALCIILGNDLISQRGARSTSLFMLKKYIFYGCFTLATMFDVGILAILGVGLFQATKAMPVESIHT